MLRHRKENGLRVKRAGESVPEPGRLFVVAVPIGHPKDITLRAIEVLQSVAAVICEEYREGSTLLAKLGIQNELIVVNEHNEKSESLRVVDLLWQGKSLALISDCGTPVFADPGQFLLRTVVQAGLSVVPIPGPSSLIAALSVCDFPMEQFVFGGFLPRERDRRRRELERLREMRLPIILMDTPYRMIALLQDVAQVFGNKQQVMLACDLTLPSERIYRGEIEAVLKQVEKRKREFVLILK